MAEPVSATNAAAASVSFFMAKAPLFMIAFVAITTALQGLWTTKRPGPNDPIRVHDKLSEAVWLLPIQHIHRTIALFSVGRNKLSLIISMV